MKNVIHIYGASGSGTTTLGRKICQELGYKLMDTDDYFWLPTNPKFIKKRPISERVELMKKDVYSCENAVISGSLAGWGDELIPYFTLAVRIELDTSVRIERLIKREKERFGSRIEKGGDMYEQHVKFIKWAKDYDKGDVNMRSKVRHDEWEKLLPCKIIYVNGEDLLCENFKKVKQAIENNK